MKRLPISYGYAEICRLHLEKLPKEFKGFKIIATLKISENVVSVSHYVRSVRIRNLLVRVFLLSQKCAKYPAKYGPAKFRIRTAEESLWNASFFTDSSCTPSSSEFIF